METIAGIPYTEAEFDKDGKLIGSQPTLTGVTDLFVISHGWNNNAADARTLYRHFFTNFMAVGKPEDLAGRACAVIGVIWPSKKFDELVAAADSGEAAQGSAGLGTGAAESRAELEAKLDAMKRFFVEPGQQQSIEEARTLLPDLEDKASARRAFVAK